MISIKWNELHNYLNFTLMETVMVILFMFFKHLGFETLICNHNLLNVD